MLSLDPFLDRITQHYPQANADTVYHHSRAWCTGMLFKLGGCTPVRTHLTAAPALQPSLRAKSNWTSCPLRAWAHGHRLLRETHHPKLRIVRGSTGTSENGGWKRLSQGQRCKTFRCTSVPIARQPSHFENAVNSYNSTEQKALCLVLLQSLLIVLRLALTTPSI